MSQSPARDLSAWIVAVACFFAWLPSLGPYIQIADDFPLGALLDNGVAAYLNYWTGREGIWRILGRPLIALGIQLHPLFYGALALATHTAAMLAFLAVCRALLGGTVLPLLLALIAGVFPWGHGAVLFASAYEIVAATAIFWAVVLLLWRRRADPRQAATFAIGYVLTLAAALIHELLVFASIASGTVIWLSASGARDAMRLMRHRWSGWAPAAAGLTYVAVYELLRPASAWKAPKLNPESILSVSYYQYSNAFIFEPWFSPTARQIAAASLSPVVLLGGFAAAVVLACLWRQAARTEAGRRLMPEAAWRTTAYATLLMLSASFVYAVAGGFSLDSRKKYPLVMFVLFGAGGLWRWWGALVGRRTGWALVAAVLVAGVPTTWLVTSLWRYEAARGTALVDFLATNGVSGPIRVEWEPDLYKAWPTVHRVWGCRFDDDWLLNAALEQRGAPVVRNSTSASAPLIVVTGSQVAFGRRP